MALIKGKEGCSTESIIEKVKNCPDCSDHNLHMWVLQSKENQILKQILTENKIDYMNYELTEEVPDLFSKEDSE